MEILLREKNSENPEVLPVILEHKAVTLANKPQRRWTQMISNVFNF